MTTAEARVAKIAEAGPRRWRNGPRCAQDFADTVVRYLDGLAEATLQIGMLLIEAKNKVSPREWSRMFNDHPNHVARPIPFSLRTAQRLIKIAEHPILWDATHVSLLPASWGTLHALSALPHPTLLKAIEDGKVHPAMERHHVNELLAASRTHRPVVVKAEEPDAPAVEQSEPAGDALDLTGFDRDIRHAFPDLDRDEQIRVVERLRQIANDLEGQIQA